MNNEQKHKAMEHLTEKQYKIIADRMIEEHRKYGDRLRPGHWADVAARKVASHIADFREGERVFTESEVKSKDEDMKWALNWINNEAKHLRERGEPQEALEVALEMMLERHGIVLDPA